MSAFPTSSDVRAAADRCVKCGLCLPQCPTWQIRRQESDSPRGRVELIAALAGERLEANAAVQTHLDGCLMCRACETACPAHVPFADLMDHARQHWFAGTVWPTRLMVVPFLRNLVRGLLWLAVVGRAKSWIPGGWSRRGRQLLGLLPDSIVLRKRSLAKEGQGQVGIFVGCVTDVVDRATLNDAAVLIEQGGFQPVWLDDAACCGALDRHQGGTARADAHVRRNLETPPTSLEHIVSVATGCAAEMQDYASYCDDPRVAEWSARHSEIMAFLQKQEFTFRPLAGTVFLYHPCTARNALRETRAAADLLRRIPDLQVLESSSMSCCGAAGTTLFRAPEQAQALSEKVLDEFRESGAQMLATSNIGCALHLRSALRAAGLSAAVVHPVNLLRQQLPK